MASVWGELRRRNVVKVAVAYAIVGWLLVQVADTFYGRFKRGTGDYDDAIRAGIRAVELDPLNPAGPEYRPNNPYRSLCRGLWKRKATRRIKGNAKALLSPA